MIYVDFDQTLAATAELPDAFSRFNRVPEIGTVKERLDRHREARAEYDALHWKKQIEYWGERGGSYVEWRNIHVIAFARPHAALLLQSCSELATTAILTSGITGYQGRIAYKLGFPVPAVEVYGRDRYDDVPKHPKSLLVDDLGLSTIGVQEKLKAIGSNRHIQVPVWFGTDDDDTALLDVLPKIRELLV